MSSKKRGNNTQDVSDADESPDGADSEGYWEALEILDEKKGRFFISWKGSDPTTGKPWPPSWEPRSNCTPALIQSWKAKKAKIKKGKTNKSHSHSTRLTQSDDEDDEDQRGKGKGKAKAKPKGNAKSRSKTSRAEASSSNVKEPERVDPGSPASSKKFTEISKDGPTRGVKRRRIGDSFIGPKSKQRNRSPQAKQPPAIDVDEQDSDHHTAEEVPSEHAKTSKRHEQPIANSPDTRVEQAKQIFPKPLRPPPRVSPSIFRPYLPVPDPSQETIEQFSSPEKGTRHRATRRPTHQLNVESSIVTTSQDLDPSPHEHAVVQEMEEAYLDFDPPISPEVPPSTMDQSMGQNDQTDGIMDSPLPPTASTQQAVVDSQSQPPSLSDSQVHGLIAEMNAQQESLDDTRRLVDTYKTKVNELTTENGILKADKAALQTKHEERCAELTRVLTEHKDHIVSLNATVEALRTTGLDMVHGMFDTQVTRLKEEVEMWKGRCEIFQKKDARTNDKIRTNAALVYEMTEKNKQLEIEVARYQAEVTASDFFYHVCQHVQDGVSCYQRFPSDEDVRKHAISTHYSHLYYGDAAVYL